MPLFFFFLESIRNDEAGLGAGGWVVPAGWQAEKEGAGVVLPRLQAKYKHTEAIPVSQVARGNSQTTVTCSVRVLAGTPRWSQQIQIPAVPVRDHAAVYVARVEEGRLWFEGSVATRARAPACGRERSVLPSPGPVAATYFCEITFLWNECGFP